MISDILKKEERRQEETLNLIASENYASRAVRAALGSVFVNKYAEGYPHARYYAGNRYADELEEYVQRAARSLFQLDETWHVNVQPYSGSPANLAVYHALVPPGGAIMGMALSMGGHLTHGHKVSMSGKLWRQVPYGVDKNTGRIDMAAVREIAERERPNLIVAGYTAYSRVVDFSGFRQLANDVGALLMVDMSHIAGLVAGGVYPSPFAFADVVTSTTHKTLRGPRSAIIFARDKYAEVLDKAVFPGLQGGPHLNQIAAVGVALEEAATSAFKDYAARIVRNASALSEHLRKAGWSIVSGGTDTHLFLVDTYARGLTGKAAEDALEGAHVTVNKNAIPFDARNPRDPSGIRIGTAAATTRGMKEPEMETVAELVDTALTGSESPETVKSKVLNLCKYFPVYPSSGK